MKVYQCDMCGDIHKSIGEMTEVQIKYAGRSSVKYPRNGQFEVCDKCESKLLKLLLANDDSDENKEE